MYVDMDQVGAGGMPRWLVLGLEASRKPESVPAPGGKLTGVWAEHDPRTLHRFSRVVRFLQRHYPDALADTTFKAGSAVLLEFMQLQQVAPAQAKELAPDCFGGRITVARMRDLLADARKRQEEQAGSVPTSGNKQFADFTRMAIERLTREPGILQRLLVTSLEEIKSRQSLMPRMVAHCNRRKIALEIRAPQDSAFRSQANVAASMVSRIAVLRMRFDDVVLVMPMSSKQTAIATREMLYEWSRDARESTKTVDILLMDEMTHIWM